MRSSPLVREVRAQRRIPSPETARAIREAAGVSQGRIAQELGVDRVTVTRLETVLRRPRGERAVAYADLLGQLKRAIGD